MIGFMRKYWYYAGGALAVVLVGILAVAWHGLGPLQRILLISFTALLLHQFEEYAWPGELPAVMNVASRPGRRDKA